MLSQSYWLSLPQPVRNEMAKIFMVPKSGAVVVESFGNYGRVVSDGFSSQDLEEITLEKLSQFTGSKSVNFYEQVDLAVKIINGEKINDGVKEEVPKEVERGPAQPADSEGKGGAVKRGRPSKKVG